MGTPSSKYFTGTPRIPHLVKPRGGWSGELFDLRKDLREAFLEAESGIDLIGVVGSPDEEGYLELLPAGDPFPSSCTWWETPAKEKKILEVEITRDANNQPSSVVATAYRDGTAVRTITDTYTYDGVIPTSVSREVS